MINIFNILSQPQQVFNDVARQRWQLKKFYDQFVSVNRECDKRI